MTEEQKLPSDPGAALHLVDVDDAVEALDRKGAAIVGLSAVALVVTIWVLFKASPGPAVGLAVLVLLGLKKAVVEYRELSRKKTNLLATREGATGGEHPPES